MKTGKWFKTFLSVLILFACITAGCGTSTPSSASGEKSGTSVKSQADWTVMLYLCGSDLETIFGNATNSIQEMLDADPSDRVNGLIQTGGAESWWMDGIESDCMQRFHIANHKLIEDQKIESDSMGKADVLSSFIQWGTTQYPAKKYMLILWDHGGGAADGLCTDELYGDCLYLDEVRKAVSTANVPIEVVGMDACLMACLEAAETYQGYAHYMVASEETEPGSGWDFKAIMDKLAADPGCDGKTIGIEIVDSYFRKLERLGQGKSETLSVTDLTKIPVLSAAFKELSSELVLTTQDTERIRAVSHGARNTESFGSNSDTAGYSNMVDLGNLLDNTKDTLASAGKVKDALKKAVIYEKHGEYRSKANGLSVLYPLRVNQNVIDSYSSFSDNQAYIKYLSIVANEYDSNEWVDAWMKTLEKKVTPGPYDKYFDSGIGDEGYSYVYNEDTLHELQKLKPVSEKDYTIEYEAYIDDDGYYTMNITSGLEAVEYVYFEFCMDIGEGGFTVLGTDSDIVADYEKGVFSDNFRGTWLGFDDHIVYSDVIEETDDYVLFSIPVRFQNSDWTIRTAYDFKTEEYSVIGMYESADEKTGMASKSARDLKPGDHLELVFPIFWDGDSSHDGQYVWGEITWQKDTEFGEIPLDDGFYYYNLVIQDVFGNKIHTDEAIIDIDGDDINFYMY